MGVSKKMRILLIDDVQEMREMLRETLRKVGFKKVDIAQSSKIAMEKIVAAKKEDAAYELIMCDYDLPDVNGIDFFLKLQEFKVLKTANFILMSGDDDGDILKSAVMKGIKHIILKPFSKESLTEKLCDIYN